MISIILPSTGREQQLDKLLTTMEAVLPWGSEIVVILDHADIVEREKYATIGRLLTSHLQTRFVVTKNRGCWKCKNVGLEYAKHDLIMWTADDVKPHHGWLATGLECFNKHFPKGLGLVALNDLHCRDQTAGHAITTRQFLFVMFGYPHFPPKFGHFFCDTVISDRAKALRRYHFCKSAIIEHMHWRLGKAERDATNERNENRKFDDKAIKDAMDEVWLHQGGFTAALHRLEDAA